MSVDVCILSSRSIPLFSLSLYSPSLFPRFLSPQFNLILSYFHTQAGLMQRALEHYTDLADIKRIMQQGGGALNPEFLLGYFGTISR